MVVQTTPDDAKSVQPMNISPLLQRLSINSENSFFRDYNAGGNLQPDLDSVGTKDLIYFPQCTGADLITVPQNYHMFILTKPHSLLNIVLVKHTFLREIKSSLPNNLSLTTPQRLIETWNISNRLAMFYQEAKSDFPGKDLLLHDLAQIITTMLLRNISKSAPTQIQPSKRKSKDIGPVIEYIHKNYPTPITLKDLARQINYSHYHFIRIFKKETGKSPIQYLTDIRLEKARELLSTTTLTITEICLQCGFQNSSHFATVFKQHTGISPSKYQSNYIC